MTHRVAALFAIASVFGTGAVSAHEILLVPRVADGNLKVTIESTHRFVAAEELENATTLEATLVTPAGTETLPITQFGALSLGAEGKAPTGAAYLVVHRQGLVYSNTPDGFKPGTRVENPDAIFTNRYEKYSKALIDGSDAAFAMAPLGHPLEIVPLSNPADLKAGDELKVQVLHNGQPIAAEVQATFAGFSDTPMTFAYSTETGDEYGEPGVAKVKVWEPGYWYVRVAHEAEDPDANVDTHVLRAILSFEVK
jgi:uncharacterized GH25 family protein